MGEQNIKKNINIGLLAHVDAGKTTLAEAILYKAGKTRKLGRVDHKDSVMDTHELEKQRGITIFASQAVFSLDNYEITLLDTPGHVDFSGETERILGILDYAILVISGTDGVQAHTHTLWKLLNLYNIPTFIFITKMDFSHKTKEELILHLQKELNEGCINFEDNQKDEMIALLGNEEILDEYINTGKVSTQNEAKLIKERKVFPCRFGSGLKLDGIDEFLSDINEYIIPNDYPEKFGAKVFKINHDNQGTRLTHIKLTGGKLKVRDTIEYDGISEKISQIRIYNGAKFTTVDEVTSGAVCCVAGLSKTNTLSSLGYEKIPATPQLEAVMNYRVNILSNHDTQTVFQKLKILEQEDPQLKISYNNHLQEINIMLMGQIQIEIIKNLMFQRFDIDIDIDKGRVMYKETITDTVEGVGHYEPLRHYAEVHLLMEPLPKGSGLEFDTRCSEEVLSANWQRLVLTHLMEKTHLGILTGSPITDIKITLVSGRSHIKHTEGGDFRQATYRAVRQGLMQAKSKLLEPYYAFKLEVPPEQLGRAINDIKMRHGAFNSPYESNSLSVITGRAPVTTLNDYITEVSSYTSGRGRLSLELDGYDDCHNPEYVIESLMYNPTADTENSPDSIFCAHGGGFNVKWNEVKDYMHLESYLKEKTPYVANVNRRNLSIDEKELQLIMQREFGEDKHPYYRLPTKTESRPKELSYESVKVQKRYIIDGYNVIYAWEDLKELSEIDLSSAREKLIHILSNFSAFTNIETVLVFDGYNAKYNPGEKFNYQGIHIVYTKENETADAYIQKLLHEIGKNTQVFVVTSDNLVQLSAFQSGALRMSAREFEEEVASVNTKIGEILKKQPKEVFEIKDIINKE